MKIILEQEKTIEKSSVIGEILKNVQHCLQISQENKGEKVCIFVEVEDNIFDIQIILRDKDMCDE